jgi:hypothetical protein
MPFEATHHSPYIQLSGVVHNRELSNQHTGPISGWGVRTEDDYQWWCTYCCLYSVQSNLCRWFDTTISATPIIQTTHCCRWACFLWHNTLVLLLVVFVNDGYSSSISPSPTTRDCIWMAMSRVQFYEFKWHAHSCVLRPWWLGVQNWIKKVHPVLCSKTSDLLK